MINPFQFAYDAIADKQRRRSPSAVKQSEAWELKGKKRDKLYATSYDLVRNCPEAAWVYNKFLDYTTSFYFQAKTDSTELNREIENAVAEWSKKENCDVAGRHSLAEIIRLFGAGICLDGDSAILKCDNAFLQGIEADRIKTPTSGAETILLERLKACGDEGILFNKAGRVEGYVICDRDPNDANNRIFNQIAAPEHVIFDGNFFRFDQNRGVGLFASALNIFQDIREIDEYQLIKAKKHAMFGIMLKSDHAAGDGFNGRNGVVAESSTSGDAVSQYLHAMNAGLKLEGEATDGVEMFESKTPSQEYQTFSELQLRKAFAAFGVPYSFFDSRQSSFSAQKQDRAEFSMKVRPFRSKIYAALENIMVWALPQILKKYGVSASEEALAQWELVPEGEPWLDENNEVQAAGLRVAYGLSSRTLECKRRGLDFFDIATALAREQETIKENGLVVAIGQPGMASEQKQEGNKK